MTPRLLAAQSRFPACSPKGAAPEWGPRAAPHLMQLWALTVIRLLLREQLQRGEETADERHEVLAGGSEEGGGITIPSQGSRWGAPESPVFHPRNISRFIFPM